MTQTKSKKQKSQTIQKNDSIIVCWCDNGTTDGKFTEGLVYTLLTAKDVPIKSAMRIQGNQIGRQRQEAFDYWLDHTDFPWILWVDSDIELTAEAVSKMWSICDPVNKPVVSGTYFVSKENEKSLMTPYPALFSWTEDMYTIGYVHPLPANAIIQVGAAGFGLLLMHRNAGKKMREHHGNIPFFNETGVGRQFVSEDINFFRMMAQAGVPLFAHTGATVKHMKRFALDVEYYKIIHETNTRTQA